MKTFLAAGDVLINPSLLAYAAVDTDSEGPQLRLGFAGQAGSTHYEVRLTGLEARSVLRWLRTTRGPTHSAAIGPRARSSRSSRGRRAVSLVTSRSRSTRGLEPEKDQMSGR
jgi:hypothetical protein